MHLFLRGDLISCENIDDDRTWQKNKSMMMIIMETGHFGSIGLGDIVG